MKSTGIFILYRDTIALCVTVFLSLILFFYNDSPYVDSIESDITDLYHFILFPKVWYKDILSVKGENQLLSGKVTQLNLLLSQMDHYRLENDQLRKMLNFVSTHYWSLLPANVTNHRTSMVQTIIIDRGLESGVSKNLPIMDMNGLMGKTVAIGKHAAKIQLITDKNYRVSIRVGEERSLGIFVPTHGKFGILDGVRKSMLLDVDEIAYTSGISDIYPANIPVAKVISVNKDNNRAFQDVVVEILSDLDNLNYVFIVQ